MHCTRENVFEKIIIFLKIRPDKVWNIDTIDTGSLRRRRQEQSCSCWSTSWAVVQRLVSWCRLRVQHICLKNSQVLRQQQVGTNATPVGILSECDCDNCSRRKSTPSRIKCAFSLNALRFNLVFFGGARFALSVRKCESVTWFCFMFDHCRRCHRCVLHLIMCYLSYSCALRLLLFGKIWLWHISVLEAHISHFSHVTNWVLNHFKQTNAPPSRDTQSFRLGGFRVPLATSSKLNVKWKRHHCAI